MHDEVTRTTQVVLETSNAFPLHSRGMLCLRRARNERMYAMQMHRHIDESSHEGFHEEYARSNVGPMSVDGDKRSVL